MKPIVHFNEDEKFSIEVGKPAQVVVLFPEDCFTIKEKFTTTDVVVAHDKATNNFETPSHLYIAQSVL